MFNSSNPTRTTQLSQLSDLVLELDSDLWSFFFGTGPLNHASYVYPISESMKYQKYPQFIMVGLMLA